MRGREDLPPASQTVLANLLAAQHTRAHCVPPRAAYGSRFLHASAQCAWGKCRRVCDLSAAAMRGREDLPPASQTLLANLLAAQHTRGHCVPPRAAYGSRFLHVSAQCAWGK